MEHRRKVPSAGSLIGLIALVAALAGTAIALPGKDTVNSGDIKKNAVKGKDAKESSFGTVPNAKTVAGTELKSFHFEVAVGGSTEQFEFGGVRLEANCAGAELNPDLANISGQGAEAVFGGTLLVAGTPVPIAGRDEELTEADFFSLDGGENGEAMGQVTAQVLFADGSVATVEASSNSDTVDGCEYWGRVTSG